MTTIKPRKAILTLREERPPSGRGGKIRLDMNENTRGAARSVVRSVRRAVIGRQLGTYPEYGTACAELARHFKVSADELLLTNGIDDAIKLICDTFVDPGDTLLVPALTFTMYRFFQTVAGGKTAVVHHDEHLRLPLHDVLRALRQWRPRWLALANPNNPTGTMMPQDDLRAILRAAPATLVLVDEAYFDYSDHTVLTWIRRFPNLVVARTFSKAYGLAGLRLGVLLARRELTGWMRRAHAVFPVNSMAVAAALEAIRHPEEVERHVREVRENRDRLCHCLNSLGVPYSSSAANFVFACFGPKAPQIARRLAKDGILVRHWGRDPQLHSYFRIGIGTRSEIGCLIRALRSLRHMIEPLHTDTVWRGVAEYSATAH
ncbi:MAG TPA: histidinol-phosphate transaminase [Terriglobia bacterium]|nr:histidinol-phosphate transaminase [Terriglobia bacterium]